MINTSRKPEFFQTRTIQNRNQTLNHYSPAEKSNIGETKRLKVQILNSSNTQNWPG